MTARLIGTGVLIDLSAETAEAADIVVAVELFADIEVDGTRERRLGPSYFADIRLDQDPTNQLVGAAHVARESNLGTIFGDLKRARLIDLARFEFYAAPFRIELSDALRERLDGSWEGRGPRS